MGGAEQRAPGLQVRGQPANGPPLEVRGHTSDLLDHQEPGGHVEKAVRNRRAVDVDPAGRGVCHGDCRGAQHPQLGDTFDERPSSEDAARRRLHAKHFNPVRSPVPGRLHRTPVAEGAATLDGVPAVSRHGVEDEAGANGRERRPIQQGEHHTQDGQPPGGVAAAIDRIEEDAREVGAEIDEASLF